jgi:hypothetical protein
MVLNAADHGTGTLRQAILDANATAGADTILFANRLSRITLLTGELTISDSVTLEGPGAAALTISGNGSSRVFHVTAGTVTLAGMTIANGLADGRSSGVASAGGGIFNAGDLTLIGVTLSHNRAIGDPQAIIPAFPPILLFAGGALGGGVANVGNLTVLHCTFMANVAQGANHTTSAGPFPGGPAFPGIALGGGLYNLESATVIGSRFLNNVARAGNDGHGDFAATAGGGGIYNDNALTVSGSAFAANLAMGGNHSTSASHNGHALGGGIASGTLTALLLPTAGHSASLTVNTSSFKNNQAQGGNDNQTTVPGLSRADGPNQGFGGGIMVYQGTATIRQSWLSHNWAVGGKGGSDQNGGLGVGGGIFFFDFLGGITAVVSNTMLTNNAAIGGAGRDDLDGGSGLGGGIASSSLGSPFGGPGTVQITSSTITANLARGGLGGRNGDGGHGQGGGLFNDTGVTLTVTTSTIFQNRAGVGQPGAGGRRGQGIGGGVFNLGTFSTLATTISLNTAATSNNNTLL